MDWRYDMAMTLNSFPPEMAKRLKNGESCAVGSKIYKMCMDCYQVVQINKPLIGSLNFCKD